jgi:hypothetical protein
LYGGVGKARNPEDRPSRRIRLKVGSENVVQLAVVTSVFEIDLHVNDVLEIQSGCFDLMLYVVETPTLVAKMLWRVRRCAAVAGDKGSLPCLAGLTSPEESAVAHVAESARRRQNCKKRDRAANRYS